MVRRGLLALGVVGALAGFTGTAQAAGKPSCGGAWNNGHAECSFVYQGGSVFMGMSLFSDLAGAGAVRLERAGAAGREVIWTCPVLGMWSACAAGSTSDEPFTKIGGKLWCVVEAAGGRGRYSCSSGD